MTHLDIYKEHILDLYKHPHNFGEIENATHKAEAYNALCGDQVEISIITENNKIKDIKFQGHGCAISIAAASMLTDKIKDMSIDQVLKLSKDDVINLLKIPISHQRIKCALHSLDAIKNALNKKNKKEQ
jgi:nitrogen fixation NifU-like protein